jgi:transcriptional regulator with XRE-family HTH domain
VAHVDIGQIIRSTRERKRPRMSQASLAELVGVHKKTVGKWENGQQVPSRHLVALQDALGIELVNRQPVPARPTELSEKTYAELLHLQMQVTAELARRGEPRPADGPSANGWSIVRRGDLPGEQDPPLTGQAR